MVEKHASTEGHVKNMFKNQSQELNEFRLLAIKSFTKEYSNAVVPNAKILFSNLSHSDFSNKNLEGSTFTGCILNASDFTNSNLNNCVFEYCMITDPKAFPKIAANTIDKVKFIACNFDLTNKHISTKKEDTEISKMLNEVEQEFSIEVNNQVRSLTLNTLKKVLTYTHLLYNEHEFFSRNGHSIYEKLLKQESTKSLLGTYYYDVVEFFLSFCNEPILIPDYKHFLEAECNNELPEGLIHDRVIQNLFDKIHLKIESEQLKALAYIEEFYFTYLDFVNIDQLFSLLLSPNQTIRVKAGLLSGYILNELGHDYIVTKITKHEFQQKITPYLIQVLTGKNDEMILKAFYILNQGDFWEWKHGQYVVNLMNSTNIKVKNKAKKIAESIGMINQ